MENSVNIRQTIRFAIKVACVILLIAGLALMGCQYYAANKRKIQNNDLKNLYFGLFNMSALAEETDELPLLESEEPAEAGDYEGEAIAHEDYAELLEINEHLVGWLECGESISLPVVYFDNEYYLDHDFYGKYDKAGTVFINQANTIWPADKNLLFHGHNMKYGDAFGTLDNYHDVEYLQEYPVISWRTIYDAEPVYYVPVALFDATLVPESAGYFNIGKIKFDSDEEFVEYANSAIERSRFEMPFDVQADDNLISLITCSYEYENGRLLIIARALREGETVEGVTELMQEATER